MALFERRPFKYFQTNGTTPRSSVTKPTRSLGVRRQPACCPAPSCASRRFNTPPTPPKKRRKRRGRPRGAHAHGGESARLFFLVCVFHSCASHDGSYMRRTLRDVDILKCLRGEKRMREGNAASDSSDTEKDSSSSSSSSPPRP